MSSERDRADEVDIGEDVYDGDGNRLGTIRGFDGDGFYVSVRDGIEGFSVEHARAGHEFGQAELMWRCADCGEMGELEGGLPATCPSCDAPKENIYYWTED